ncbi:MAG: hypothetical protein B7X40_05505 [Cellulomonas sp. 14-74-6]|jgi:uncharacterized protein YqgC (DUF456 family)|nr:MAG: hypothetical protein B7X40_05505 [Cellulomonas sp. 14-74-6]
MTIGVAGELTWVVGALVAVGLVGTVVQVLPGGLLVGAAVAGWGALTGGPRGWTVTVVAVLLTAAGQVLKYLLAGRRLRRGGVPRSALGWGGVLGVVGFVVVPVVGVALGFVLGVYLAERLRLRSHAAARRATGVALRAAGLTVLVELAAALLVAGVWVVALVTR